MSNDKQDKDRHRRNWIALRNKLVKAATLEEMRPERFNAFLDIIQMMEALDGEPPTKFLQEDWGT